MINPINLKNPMNHSSDLCYDIIKAHGGEIKVDTKEGEEAVFIIELPVSTTYLS